MLKLKIRPGQRICIGKDVTIDVFLGADRKLGLIVRAPESESVSRIEPIKPQPEAPETQDLA